MTIPRNITARNILDALSEIDREGIPAKFKPTRFALKHDGKFYPPKHVISIANRYANGEELPKKKFSGGEESNRRLKRLGFEIVPLSKVKDGN